jgi:hypothetical protein
MSLEYSLTKKFNMVEYLLTRPNVLWHPSNIEVFHHVIRVCVYMWFIQTIKRLFQISELLI